MVEGHAVAERDRQGEDPLAHGDVWQNVIDEMGGGVGHAATAAGGAEAPPFSAERDQRVVPTATAPQAGQTMGQDATLEILLELALDEGGEAPGSFGGLRVGQERVQMLLHHAVENRVLWSVALIADAWWAERGHGLYEQAQDAARGEHGRMPTATGTWARSSIGLGMAQCPRGIGCCPLGWAAGSALGPRLGQLHGDRLVYRVANPGIRIAKGLKQLFVKRGNPFFLEETVRR